MPTIGTCKALATLSPRDYAIVLRSFKDGVKLHQISTSNGRAIFNLCQERNCFSVCSLLHALCPASVLNERIKKKKKSSSLFRFAWSLVHTINMANSQRVYNFNAGPAAIPVPVYVHFIARKKKKNPFISHDASILASLERAQAEMLNWSRTGMSIMEVSHRSKAFEDFLHKTERDFRTLLYARVFPFTVNRVLCILSTFLVIFPTTIKCSSCKVEAQVSLQQFR